MNHNDEKDPKMEEWNFISMCCIKMLTININNYQKNHKAETTEGRAQNKAFEATKLIPGPETIKISTRMLKCKRLNRVFLEKNLEQQTTSLERV